ncbi:MAG: glycosyltransferase [Phycisphaerales bacterium]
MPATAAPLYAPPTATAPPRLPIPAKVGGLLKAAMTALEQSRWADAVELTAAAAVQDIQHENMTFLASAAGAGVIGELYESAFGGAANQQISQAANETVGAEASRTHLAASPRCHLATVLARPLRVLYIHPGLSPGQAATDRLLNVVERHDRSRIAPMVLCTEEFTSRVPALRYLQWPHAPSSAHAAAQARLRSAGAPPTIIQPLGSYLDSARAAVEAARAMSPDIAVFIASAACPVQALMALQRVAPVQINQNIGSPLIVRGMDAAIYRNPSRLRDDSTELARRGIEGIDLPAAGTDLHAADAARAVPRAVLGVPTDAVLFVSAGNKLAERLTMGSFAADLAEFLKQHSKAWWMGVGAGDFTMARAVFAAAGVQRRVVLVGGQSDIRPHLKAADAYLNEYPEGGSNTVLEAMACGVPVLAVKPADGAAVSHCAGIGAEIVGDDAVSLGDYWATASNWLRDAAERRRIAARAIGKARTRFGFDALVGDYEAIYTRLARGTDTEATHARARATA